MSTQNHPFRDDPQWQQVYGADGPAKVGSGVGEIPSSDASTDSASDNLPPTFEWDPIIEESEES